LRDHAYPAERRHLIGFLADHDTAFALRFARQDLEIRSDVETHAWFAWSLLQAGQADEAAIHVDDALRLGGDDAWQRLHHLAVDHGALGELTDRDLADGRLETGGRFHGAGRAEHTRQVCSVLRADPSTKPVLEADLLALVRHLGSRY
jgi:hypothetical protein